MADHTLQLQSGLILGYAEYGDPQGTVMFYYHGWPSARVQGVLMDQVGKRFGLRIIAPDRPGIGLSDFQPKRTLMDWPIVLSQLADHLGAERFHVMGWSGGGPYVLATAKAMPERLLSATICCGAPPLRFLGYQHMFWVYRFMIHLRTWFPPILGIVLRLGKLIASGRPDRPPLCWLMRMLGQEDRRVLSDPSTFEVVRGGMMEALRRGPSMVIADADVYLSEWGFEVSSIDPLIHFWHGKDDQNISWKYSEQVAALMPHTTTHWLVAEGHYSLPITHLERIVKHALASCDADL
jgi:pimeloyl-ACP methyl ester carboxylesterase